MRNYIFKKGIREEGRLMGNFYRYQFNVKEASECHSYFYGYCMSKDFKIVLNRDCISFVAPYEKVAYRNTWDGRIHYDDFISFKHKLNLIKEDVMWYK